MEDAEKELEDTEWCEDCPAKESGPCSGCRRFKVGDRVCWPKIDSGYGIFIGVTHPDRTFVPGELDERGPDARVFDLLTNSEFILPVRFLEHRLTNLTFDTVHVWSEYGVHATLPEASQTQKDIDTLIGKEFTAETKMAMRINRRMLGYPYKNLRTHRNTTEFRRRASDINKTGVKDADDS